METKVTLCDKKDEVVEAWRTRFLKNPEVDIVAGDIFGCDCDAVVIPGNSFGFLDRGLEFQAGELFGFELQDIISAVAMAKRRLALLNTFKQAAQKHLTDA